MLRIVTGAILLPLLWLTIKQAPPWAFIAVALLVIGVAAGECSSMLVTRGGRPFSLVGVVASAAVAWSFGGYTPTFEVSLPLLLATLMTLGLSMRFRDEPRAMLESSFYTLFPVLFVGLPLGYLVRLRGIPGELGQDLLLLLFVCVILADTAAYYVGTTWGRHPMAPRLSPKKTWEGAAGALVASLIGALIAHFWFYQRLPLEHALILGLVLGVAGILGDLAESLVKRATGVKDSSRLLPGHGGLLDRTDSLLFSGPILYYYARVFLWGSS